MDLLHFRQHADFARQSAKKLVGRARVDATMANLESRLMEGRQDEGESWGSAEGHFASFVRSAKLGNCALRKCVPRH